MMGEGKVEACLCRNSGETGGAGNRIFQAHRHKSFVYPLLLSLPVRLA